MTDTAASNASRSVVASNYLVEVDNKGARAFVVCQTMLIITEGEHWGGLTSDDIARFIERAGLRAAALPGRPLHPSEFRSGPGF